MVDQSSIPDDLPDDCIVVRGGHMGVAALIRSAFVCYDRCGYFAWSFWAREGATADEIARDARFDNKEIRESTVARLRAAGFVPRRDRGEDDHVQVRLSGEPSGEACERLRAAFDPPRRRPD